LTKYSKTEKINDRKPAMTNGSFSRSETGSDFISSLSMGTIGLT
jgi:hypothetical protein